MRFGILGTGMVGKTFADRLTSLGHEVMVGARNAESQSLAGFSEFRTGSFADAAAFGELLINCTNGNHSVDVVSSCEASALEGKTLLDVANRLDPSRGIAAAALASPDNCLALAIQASAPGSHVVKALNTMNCSVMVDPALVPGDHAVFISGDDTDAKTQVKDMLWEFGWRGVQVIDLGGLETATGPEMLMQLWLDVAVARGGFGAGPFNFAVNAG